MPPTGEQYALVHGEQRAVVAQVGATLRTYDVSGRAVIDGFGRDEQVVGARGQVLLPWPNRVADGRWSWQGSDHQLALSEPDKACAIHGLTRWAPWRLVALEAGAVRLEHLLPGQTGWPFVLRCEVSYQFGDGGLTATATVSNVGATASPFALGAHPYLSAGGGLLDDCELEVPATHHLPADARGIPTGCVPVEGTVHDWRQARPLGDVVLDQAFTGLQRGSDGRARLVLRRPDGSAVQLWAGPGFGYLQVFSGDTLPAGQRRRGLAAEPMTAPPNALATGIDLLVLAPGETRTLTWGLGPA